MRAAGAIALTLLVALGAAGVAQAERKIEGNLDVTFDGRISPHALPRTGTAPVSVVVDSSFATTDESDPPPQLRTIAIGINRAGKIDDRGLPTCRVGKIQPATIRAAKRICHSAIVGRGHVGLRIHLANQPAFTFRGPLLMFHATPAGGERRLLAQVYGNKPPSAFVLTFKIVQTKGTFGTLLKTSLPRSARDWAYVTHFDLHLRRIYTYEGHEHSFISAGCAAPEGFPGAVFPFARADFGFAGGRSVTSTLVRDCAVR
jgi:hypothetical protein